MKILIAHSPSIVPPCLWDYVKGIGVEVDENNTVPKDQLIRAIDRRWEGDMTLEGEVGRGIAILLSQNEKESFIVN